MSKRFIILIAASIVAIVSSFSSLAQARIDKLVSSLEKDPEVQVTYTERRDPRTKKITRQSLILSGSKQATADILWNAFEQERSNSVSVTKTRNQSFIIKFQDKNYNSSYVLSVNGNSWSLVITKRSPDEGENDWSYNFDLGELDSLDLSSLSQLNVLDTLKFIDGEFNNGAVYIYNSDGNVVYKSSSSSSKSKSSKKSDSKSKSKSTSTSTSISSGNAKSTRTVTTTNPDGTVVISSYSI